MPRAAQYGSLPFQEQIDFFRQKLNLPTQSWTDLWHGMHARAFVIAGATKDALLTDFFEAVDKGISQGTTLADFRKDFDRIVATHGWSYKGSRGWRSRTIYETNLRASYAAARYKQLQALKASRPYWQYVHSDAVEHPRPQHQAWGAQPVILKADDAWWDTHYPPNGWGCQCKVFSLDKKDVEKLGKDVDQLQAPEIRYVEKVVGANGPNPRSVRVPEGIDPGWGYNPGRAAYGQTLSKQVMDDWAAQGADQWERLTPGDATTYARPDRIPLDRTKVALSDTFAESSLAPAIRSLLGGKEKAFAIPGGPAILVDADILAQHLEPARSRYLPFLPETLTDPFEVWAAFERHKGSGRYELRYRVIKAIDVGGDKGRGLFVSAQAVNGRLEAWTFFPVRVLTYLEKQRVGQLIYSRPK